MTRKPTYPFPTRGDFETGKRPWPEPTVEEPDVSDLMEMELLGYCEATDGCAVEPDGICDHGHPSWLLRLGLI